MCRRVSITILFVLMLALISPAFATQTKDSLQRVKLETGTPYINVNKMDLPSLKNAGQDQALSLASGDFDSDGVADVAVGYASGRIAVFRGNIDSIFPNSKEATERKANGTFTDAPFIGEPRTFRVTNAARFLAAGDFDNDGNTDLVAAGDMSLHLLSGDGKGGFTKAKGKNVTGKITAMTADDVNRRDGLMDLVVGLHGKRPQLLVFEGPDGAFRATPEKFDLNTDAVSIAVGQLDGKFGMDIAVGGGHDLTIISGRDRKIALDKKTRDKVGAPVVSRQQVADMIRSISVGDFDGDYKKDVAVLTGRGVEVLAQRNGGWEKVSMQSGDRFADAGSMITARVSSRSEDTAVLLDRVGSDLQVIHRSDAPVRLDLGKAPVAAIAMQLNSDAIEDLVLIHQGFSMPSLVLSAPVNIFTVNDDDDIYDDNVCDLTRCTLREAIDDANASAGADAIVFDIGGTNFIGTNEDDGEGFLGLLPTITEAVTIDGTTQPVDHIISLDLNTADAPCDANNCDGFRVNGGGSVIRGFELFDYRDGVELLSASNIVSANTIMDGARGGVRIVGAPGNTVGGSNSASRNYIFFNSDNSVVITGAGATGNTISGNYLGLESDGVTGNGVTMDNLLIQGAGDNTIGGTTNQRRNVITAASDAGIHITFGGSGNLIQGNYIGTNALGNSDIPNFGQGVYIDSSANNTIGGTAAGARNVISGNDSDGILIDGFADEAAGNVIQGNYIGVNSLGQFAITNFGDGIDVEGPDNVIGGVTASARNVISGNDDQGIDLDNNGEGFTGLVVQGNYIGVNATATDVIGNAADGITLFSFSQIGGSAAGAGNIISGNGSNGVTIYGSENFIQGNIIGTNPASDIEFGNGGEGVAVFGDTNTIGGDVAGAGNVIAWSILNGILVDVSGNTIQGNIIGLGPDGETPLGNSQSGIKIWGESNNTIGGSTAAARNVVSANVQYGIWLADDGGTGSDFNTIEGNYVGTSADGETDQGNVVDGIWIEKGVNNEIGVDVGNVISGNGQAGVVVSDADNNVRMNYVGLSASGSMDLGNDADGVVMDGGSTSCEITGNRIGGNGVSGIALFTSDHTIAGNYIGTNAAGTAAVGNDQDGIFVTDDLVVIGGFTDPGRNVISGNGGNGIALDGNFNATFTDILIQNNLIGVSADGTTGIGNMANGVLIENVTDTSVLSNVISGNTGNGVTVDSTSTGTVISKNIIGLDEAGASAIGNDAGVSLDSDNNTVGGATAADGNVISGNGGTGVYIGSGGGDTITNNDIGTDKLGTADLGNGGDGIRAQITGDVSVDTNLILFNDGMGINLGSGSAMTITDNSIADNGGLGIDLAAGANSDQTAPSLVSAFISTGTTTVLGSLNSTAAQSFTFQAFKSTACDPSGFGEGQTKFDEFTGVTNGSGLFAINKAYVTLAIGEFVTITATNDTTLETSEFSNCAEVKPPAQFIINDVSKLEPDSATSNMTFTVSLSPATPLVNTVTVTFTTNPGTALAGSDYVFTTGTATILAGQTVSQPITIPIVGDKIDELTETFTVDLTNPSGTTILDGQGVGTITDDDLLLFDDFQDGIPTWTVTAGTVQELNFSLVASGGGKALAPTPWNPSLLTQCDLCLIEANMLSAGGTKSQAVLRGWFVDETTNVEVRMLEASNTWQLTQKSAGTTVATKKKKVTAIDPNTPYNVKISFNGNLFTLTVDGVQLFTMTKGAGTTPLGNVGVRAKRTTATFNDIKVTKF